MSKRDDFAVCTECHVYPVRDCAGHMDGLCWPCRHDRLMADATRHVAELERLAAQVQP